MRLQSICAMLAALALQGSAAIAAAPPPSREAAVLAELNFARTQPQAYIRHLREVAAESERSGRYSNPADGDDGALEEAIHFLERQAPAPPLAPEGRLQESARDHVLAQGQTGDVGHGEAGLGFSERLKRRGVFAGITAEDIAYGYDRPRDIVAQLVIDRGVRGRGHRVNIFEPAFRVAGVACGPHPSYGELCVIDFATALMRP